MERICDLLIKTTPSAPRATKTFPIGRGAGETGPVSLSELQAASRAAIAELSRERRAARQAAIERAIGRAGIPRRFLHHSFDDYAAEGEPQLRALTLAREYAARFAAIRECGSCLLLVGGPGTGKTHLACAILRQVIADGYSGLFLTVSEGLRLIRSTYSPGASRTEVQVFETLTSPDLLVLDEVGVAIGNAATRRAMLFDVLNARYGEMRPTILIGNLTAAEMEAYLGERIMERLMDLGAITLPFTWSSHRRRGQTEFGTRSGDGEP
jgi:DNA replication protein DnaC